MSTYTSRPKESPHEILTQLCWPFPPARHKQRKLKGGGSWWFIDWRTIRNRLNTICPGWQIEESNPQYILHPDGHENSYCVVSVSITIPGMPPKTALGSAVIIELSSTGNDMSRGNPIERASRDGFRKCAEMFGVGEYIHLQNSDKPNVKALFNAYVSGRADSNQEAAFMQLCMKYSDRSAAAGTAVDDGDGDD